MGGGNSQSILFYEKNTSTLSDNISLTTSPIFSLTIGFLLDICVKPIVMHSFNPIIQYKSGTVKYRPLRIVEPFSTFSTSFRSTSDVSCCKSEGIFYTCCIYRLKILCVVKSVPNRNLFN